MVSAKQSSKKRATTDTMGSSQVYTGVNPPENSNGDQPTRANLLCVISSHAPGKSKLSQNNIVTDSNLMVTCSECGKKSGFQLGKKPGWISGCEHSQVPGHPEYQGLGVIETPDAIVAAHRSVVNNESELRLVSTAKRKPLVLVAGPDDVTLQSKGKLPLDMTGSDLIHTTKPFNIADSVLVANEHGWAIIKHRDYKLSRAS